MLKLLAKEIRRRFGVQAVSSSEAVAFVRVCSVYYYTIFILCFTLYCRIRIQIPNSYDLNKKKPDIRVRYRMPSPLQPEFFALLGIDLFLAISLLTCLLGQAFSMAVALRLSACCFGWFWTVARKQRVHSLFRRVHALLVQPPLLNCGFSKHSRRQRVLGIIKKAVELR
jgi:hypothetical protein